MNCKHYFGRTVKDENGIPYGYEHGCWAHHDPSRCGDECPYQDPREYRPIPTTSTLIEDIKRYLDHVREYGNKFSEVRMPQKFYAKLTEDQIAWAEETYNCKIVPYEPIVFKSSDTYSEKELRPKGTSTKEYGMSLMKRRRKR